MPAASSAVRPRRERPGARLLVARREEAEQVERLEQAADDVVERGGPVAEGGRLLVRELRQLGLELRVDPARAVLDGEDRLRRQRLEPLRQLPGVGERAAFVEVREQPLELLHLAAERRVARLRLLRDPLEPPLDVVPVGDEQLELERLQVALRGRRRARRRPARRAARPPGAGCRAAPRLCPARRPPAPRPASPCARSITAATRSRRSSRDRRHADVLLAAAEPGLRPGPGERVEERRLAGAGQPDDARLERHRSLSRRRRRRRAAAGARRARGAGATSPPPPSCRGSWPPRRSRS